MKTKYQPNLVQLWLALIEKAGFVKLTHTGLISASAASKNYNADCYFHVSVLDMTPEQQLQQPWIEHIVWADWMERDDVVEGRYLAMRFPFRKLNDLHSFMHHFGYTLPLPEEKEANPVKSKPYVIF